MRKSSQEKLLNSKNKYRDYELADLIDKSQLIKFFENLSESKSQLRQDLFVLSELGFKHDGFFVEFGAASGIDLSNTHLLETKFNWKGILAEPAKIWHEELKVNRTVNIETDCVWKTSGAKLIFNEVNNDIYNAELSTIDAFSRNDGHKKSRELGTKYDVTTIFLADLLAKYKAPKQIDYLSIDTEGSEFEILHVFDFSSHKIKVITCEHNYTPMRQKLYNLLTNNGYERKFSEFSLFDDW